VNRIACVLAIATAIALAGCLQNPTLNDGAGFDLGGNTNNGTGGTNNGQTTANNGVDMSAVDTDPVDFGRDRGGDDASDAAPLDSGRDVADRTDAPPDGGAKCVMGETRCYDRGTFMVHETCANGEGTEICPAWRVTRQCTSAQTCDPTNGCECPNPCSPGPAFDCTANPPTLCVLVDGCPQEVNACRDSACGSLTDPTFCTGSPDHPFCQNSCDGTDGRSCVLACQGTDCYTCGSGTQ